MKRRNFLTSIAGLFALPFIPKAEAKPKYKVGVYPPGTSNDPDRYSYKLFRRNPDGSVEKMTDKEGDAAHADFHKDYPLTPAQEQELVAYAKTRLSKLQSEMAP